MGWIMLFSIVMRNRTVVQPSVGSALSAAAWRRAGRRPVCGVLSVQSYTESMGGCPTSPIWRLGWPGAGCVWGCFSAVTRLSVVCQCQPPAVSWHVSRSHRAGSTNAILVGRYYLRGKYACVPLRHDRQHLGRPAAGPAAGCPSVRLYIHPYCWWEAAAAPQADNVAAAQGMGQTPSDCHTATVTGLMRQILEILLVTPLIEYYIR